MLKPERAKDKVRNILLRPNNALDEESGPQAEGSQKMGNIKMFDVVVKRVC